MDVLFHRLTRRGRLQRVLREHYLRDDLPCGLASCAKCPALLDADATNASSAAAASAVAAASAASSLPAPAPTAVVPLSSEPAAGAFAVLDTNVALHEMDALEAAGGLLDDVVVLQTVLEEVRHRSPPIHARLRALMRDPARRFAPFANAHHRDTYSERRAGESANDYNDRLIREACVWLRAHFRDAGIGIVLLTHDAANARIARERHALDARTLREYVAAAGAKHTRVLDLLADAGGFRAAGAHEEAVAEADGMAGADGGGAGGIGGASALEATATSMSASAAPAKHRGGTAVHRVGAAPGAGALYPEHLSAQQLADGVRARLLFQGIVRANRDCWFEARVNVHGLLGAGASSGRGIGDAGTDDTLPVLLVGRDAMNRSTDGDTVVIELLPQAQWKHPSTRLAIPPAKADDEERVEREALRAAQRAAGATLVGVGAVGAVAVAPTAPGFNGGGPDDDEMASSVRPASLASAASRRALVAAAAAAASSGSGSVPTGRVVGIVRRAWRQLCGSLEPEEAPVGGAVAEDGALVAQPALFVPVDARFPRIRIETRQKWALMDKRLVVALDTWPAHSRYPRGHYVRTIGTIGEKAAENEVILLEHDIISRPFSADVIACLPPADWTITPENASAGGRVDLRGLDVCSIDPPGCKDIDDALHARTVAGEPGADDEVVEVGVHIADVSYFVKHGTAIDIEAAERANTTYLVERRLDMLPGLLTETLCSLKGGIDRFAFSVTWRYRRARATGSPALGCDDRWELVPGETRFFRSVIHSRAAMTYAAAQALLDDASAQTPVARAVKLLASVARSLKRGRLDAGALSLASSEVRFMLDSETHDPLDVSAYETRETNSTVEEFMLLANIAVARRVCDSFPRCALLRRHPAPPKANFASLLAAAASVGVSLDVSSSRALADSLDKAVVAGNPQLNRLLRVLATRCMMQAAYFTSGSVREDEYAHYGLAVPIYTHFTSPIRRYADLVVHRLLAAALEYEPIPAEYLEGGHGARGRGARAGGGGMRAQCDNMNRRHLMSQLAGRASGSLHTNIFFNRRVVIENALVIRLRANGVVVLVPRFGLEGAVVLGRSRDQADEAAARGGTPAGASGTAGTAAGVAAPARILVLDEQAQTLSDAAEPALRLGIFQEVRVALQVEARGVRKRRELVIRIVDPPFAPRPRVEDLPPGHVIEDRTGLATDASRKRSAAGGAEAGGAKIPRRQ